MAINNSIFDFLEANQNIIKGKDVLMIGRQSNYLTKKYISKYFQKLDISSHSEFIWEYLKCNKIESIDFSDYESPTFTHDMNEEISANFHNKFDIIYDGGSTEHVFKIETAFSNYMKMLKKSGKYIGVLPGNNLCNHGFYQFSPDLFYRLFSYENGFNTKIFTKINNSRYFIEDLKNLNFPVHFNLNLGSSEGMLYIIAEKFDENKNFSIPFQTIYNTYLWEKTDIKTKGGLIFNILNNLTPLYIKKIIWNYRNNKLILKKIKSPNF